jgi:lipopolysaccharide transport system ATP-binding protein
MPAPAIRIENLGKRYRLGETHEHTLSDRLGRLFGSRRGVERAPAEDFWALRDVNLELAEGEALGIIGGNGAGKSTLLKILSRITQPSTGRALVRGRLASLLEVGTGFHPELSGRENVFLNGTILGMRRAEVAAKFDEIVGFAGVEKFIDTPVKRYSSGMYVRLAFAVAAHLEPDVLIVDEVLAVGDAGFQKRCLGKMGDVARQGRTVLFVSHSMPAVQKLCSRVVWLQGGQVAMNGDAVKVVAAYLDASSETLGGSDPQQAGYLYRAIGAAAGEDAVVTSLRALDVAGNPMGTISTWDDVRFRLGFSVSRTFQSFAVEICVTTIEGVPLLLTSTSPDNHVAFGVEPGDYEVDLRFESLPLAAGEYLVSARLAIPWVEFVWRHDALCRLEVAARDILGSGIPPASNRYHIAVPHHWDAPRRVGEEP